MQFPASFFYLCIPYFINIYTITKEQERAELHRAIWQIANDLRGLFDDIDVNSNKLGATVAKRNEKLVKILDAIGNLKLGRIEDNNNDLFGDAYEYLMTMYASNAGKSGGEFYTRMTNLLTVLSVIHHIQRNGVAKIIRC